MSLREEITPYRDEDFLVHPWILDREETNKSGNGVFYTSEYYTLLKLNNDLTDADSRMFEFIMQRCQVEPGLYKRSPTHTDQEGADDYYGLLMGAYFTGNHKLAEEVIEYGNNHYWIINNTNPGSFFHPDGRLNVSAWFFRYPALIAHAYWAANKTPPLILYLLWCIIVGVSCRKGREHGTDPFRVTWALVKTNNGRGWLARFVSKLFYKRLAKFFPNGGMNEVASLYYRDNHPFSRYWKD